MHFQISLSPRKTAELNFHGVSRMSSTVVLALKKTHAKKNKKQIQLKMSENVLWSEKMLKPCPMSGVNGHEQSEGASSQNATRGITGTAVLIPETSASVLTVLFGGGAFAFSKPFTEQGVRRSQLKT